MPLGPFKPWKVYTKISNDLIGLQTCIVNVEIWTRSDFGRLTFGPVPDAVNQPNVQNLNNLFQISDVKSIWKLNDLSWDKKLNFLYLKQSRLVLHPKSEQKSSNFGHKILYEIRKLKSSDFGVIRILCVRFLDVDCIMSSDVAKRLS